MKWFLALNEASPSFANYARMVQVAVHSAQKHTALQPHFLYDGEENALTRWLHDRGVRIIACRSRFHDALTALAHAGNNPHLPAVGAGALLRTELPLIARRHGIDDPYVLYTDCDVLFLGDVVPQLRRMTPRLFAVGPQERATDYEAMNTGVMLMNLDGLAADDTAFSPFVVEHLEEFSRTSWDQMAYRRFYGAARNGRHLWEHLPPEFNWKPYWGENPRAAIVHFHGPKPSQRKLAASGHLPEFLIRMAPPAYFRYCNLWERLLAEALAR